MLVRQMFMKKFLDPLADLEPGSTTVRIEWVDYRTKEAKGERGGEIEWLMKVKQFKKPFKLKPPAANTIAQLYGEETDRWKGCLIDIYPKEIEAFGRTFWVVNVVDRIPRTEPTIPDDSDPSAEYFQRPALGAGQAPRALPAGPAQAQPAPLNRAPCGKGNAERMKAKLAELGKRWDDFLAWLKRESIDAHTDAAGRPLDEIPVYVVKDFFALYVKPPPAPVNPDNVDTRTGEVLPEEDIPF